MIYLLNIPLIPEKKSRKLSKSTSTLSKVVTTIKKEEYRPVSKYFYKNDLFNPIDSYIKDSIGKEKNVESLLQIFSYIIKHMLYNKTYIQKDENELYS